MMLPSQRRPARGSGGLAVDCEARHPFGLLHLLPLMGQAVEGTRRRLASARKLSPD